MVQRAGSIADVFARFVVATKFEEIDPSVVEHLKKLTLKQVMGMVLGATAPSSAKLLRYVRDNPGKPECGVYGCGFKADVAQAALMNGFSSHASEMEDDQFPGGGISDVTVWPALLAAGEHAGLSGREALTALYVGQEMQNRIAWWASAGTDAIGILNLPFIGIYGATAACARAFGLTEEETKASFGLAMVSGLGYVYEMGTDAHYWESALVCRNAVLNALMAKNGFTSAPLIEECLERLTGGGKKIDFAKMTEGLGRAPFYTNNTWIKKWGFCFSSHVYVDILDDVMKSEKIEEKNIREVAVHFDVNRKLILDRPNPSSVDDSRFSIQHILAYQMVAGKCDAETCSEESLRDPRVLAAREKIRVIPHEDAPLSITAGDGDLELVLQDGRKLERSMEQPYGGPLYPLTMEQVLGIYRMYSKDVMSDESGERAAQMILGMEDEKDLGGLFDVCTFPMERMAGRDRVAAAG